MAAVITNIPLAEATTAGPEFDEDFRAQLNELFEWRRDVRHFDSRPLEAGLLDQLLESIYFAPSVGLSQPSRFAIVEDQARREAIIQNFEQCNADALSLYDGERASDYSRLKLAGLREAPVHIAAWVDTSTLQGAGLGSQTMPETLHYSVVLAIHTLWLSARAFGVGLGWVSILEPAAVREILEVPESWELVAYLCLGYAKTAERKPELERLGWERRRSGKGCIVRR